MLTPSVLHFCCFNFNLPFPRCLFVPQCCLWQSELYLFVLIVTTHAQLAQSVAFTWQSRAGEKLSLKTESDVSAIAFKLCLINDPQIEQLDLESFSFGHYGTRAQCSVHTQGHLFGVKERVRLSCNAGTSLAREDSVRINDIIMLIEHCLGSH